MKILMKHFVDCLKYLLVFFLLLLLLETFSYAKSNKNPNISLGIAGFGGLYDATPSVGSNEFIMGPGYGAGIIVEAMFTNRLGIHSGVWFSEIRSQYYFTGVQTKWVDFLAREINLPICLIVAHNKGIFTLNFLAGINVGYIFQSLLGQHDNILGHSEIEVIENIGHYQVGITVGFNFKFQITKFTDIFFGLSTEFYVTDLIIEDGGPDSYDHIYNGKLTLGFMFRTNLYPIL